MAFTAAPVFSPSFSVRIVADLSEYASASGTIKVPVKVYVDGFDNAGAVGDYTVSVTLSGKKD